MTENVLEFEDLRLDIDGSPVLKGISAAASVGDVIGLVGLNGAGKTTLLETALGFSPPTAGAARVFGHDSSTLYDKRLKARIGFVPQGDELLENLSGKRYLDLLAACYEHWNRDLIERLCREWSLPLDKLTGTLSVGQRQKLSILAALGHEPDLIVLDEPVASLDPKARRQFLKEVVDIASCRGRSIVFSTHIISDLERVASRLWLMRDGQIEIDEELDSLKEHTALSLEDIFMEANP